MRYIMACLLFIGIINAFQPSIVRRKSIRASTVLESVSVNDEVVTRRSWAVNSISAASAIAAFSSRSRVAGASETLAPVKSSEALSVLCDPSVSTFRNPSNNRIIHILLPPSLSPKHLGDVKILFLQISSPITIPKDFKDFQKLILVFFLETET